MPFDPAPSRRSFLQRAAIVGVGAGAASLMSPFAAPQAHAADL
ncbi:MULTISPECIES: twin-arginine translocation signal domain-containing protein, partial [unclassified Nocardiopsis]